jgi:cytidylate kinase
MIITIGGMVGSGKSTVAKALAQRLGFQHKSAGDFMREMAQERGVDLLVLIDEAKKSDSIDREIDDRTKQFVETKVHAVMDGRMAWKFIPGSFKVLLTVDIDEAARRIFAEKRPDERYNTTLAATKRNIKKRMDAEKVRYKKYYGVDHLDPKQYDLVIDTTELSSEAVVNQIIAKLPKRFKTDLISKR